MLRAARRRRIASDMLRTAWLMSSASAARVTHGMVDVVSKRCSSDSCTRRPSFNFEDINMAAFCGKHAEDGMVDVISKRCSNDSCTKTSNHNIEGMTAVYCKLHAEDGMVGVRRKRCSKDSCTMIPSFNLEGSKRRCIASCMLWTAWRTFATRGAHMTHAPRCPPIIWRAT